MGLVLASNQVNAVSVSEANISSALNANGGSFLEYGVSNVNSLNLNGTTLDSYIGTQNDGGFLNYNTVSYSTFNSISAPGWGSLNYGTMDIGTLNEISSSLVNESGTMDIGTLNVISSSEFINYATMDIGTLNAISGTIINYGTLNITAMNVNNDHILNYGTLNVDTLTTYEASSIQSTPIPAAIWMFASGLVGLGAFRKKFQVR